MYRIKDLRDDEFLGRVVKIEFAYKGRGKYVYLLGNFNAFNEGSFRMNQTKDSWKIELELPEGIWYYGFSVDGKFIVDKENPERVLYKKRSYDFSKKTSVCRAFFPNSKEFFIYHSPCPTYAFHFQDHTIIRLRTSKDGFERAFLLSDEKRFEMRKKAYDELFDYYEAILPYVDRMDYSFEVKKDNKTISYGNFNSKFKFSRNQCGPEWVYGSVFYQIMLDRFPRSSKKNNDLTGLINRLNYLSELGINALYLTPIFTSKTYHSYDVEDYYTVDQKYGGNDAFKELVEECKKRNIRICLDGVFHHTSFFHPHFQEVIQNFLTYREWYRITDLPVIGDRFKETLSSNLPLAEKSKRLTKLEKNYESFFGTWLMPRLNHDNPEVVEFIKDVGNYWVKNYDTKGWRLDVAHGVPPRIWREFRLDLPNDVYLFGEVMDDARIWIFDKFHGAMNYLLYEAMLSFFAYQEINGEEFLNQIELLNVYYGPISYMMYNFLDNHDVSRFLSLVDSKEKYRCALVFLFTYVGIPSLFYGDEIGLKGTKTKKEEGQRRPMIWDPKAQDVEILDFTKKLIDLRRKSKALQIGLFKPARFDMLMYERTFENEKLLIGINYSDSSIKIDSPKHYEVVFGNFNGFSVAPFSSFVLKVR